VYRARQAELDRDVVVKVLTNVDAKATRRRFDRERRAMGRLSQASGIAPLYGSGFTSSGSPYLLMPFYEAGSLQDLVDSGAMLTAEQVRDLGVRIARAVQTAHDNGVLHRDLKPANILLRKGGEPDVADFGIAHLADDALGTSQALTMTPLYTAPEVFDGVGSGAATDIYSVGATLYALLNGRPAYSDPNGTIPVLALMRRINQDPLPELPATVPAQLADVVAVAMAKKPADRYRSAGEFADALASVDLLAARKRRRQRNVEPSRSAKPPSASSSANKKRDLILLGIASLVLVAVVSAGGMWLTRQGGTDNNPDTASSPTAVAEQPTAVVDEPTAEPTEVSMPAAPFAVDAAAQAARQALVRVEGFSCAGVQVATGIVLADGLIVTEPEVLESPWRIDISLRGQVVPATPMGIDPELGLGFVAVEDAGAFGTLPSARVRPGDQVGLVGIDGEPVVANVVAPPPGKLLLRAEVAETAGASSAESGDLVVTDEGGLIGVARVSDDMIEIIPPTSFAGEDAQIPANFACESSRRDLQANDAESAVAPAIFELLSMQQLNNAYAGDGWNAVRRIEPATAVYSDEDFVRLWGPLRRRFVYPLDRQVESGVSTWRVGVIGHGTWAGVDLTTVQCMTWQINTVSGAIAQTNRDGRVLYSSSAGGNRLPGFVDPGDLLAEIDRECALS